MTTVLSPTVAEATTTTPSAAAKDPHSEVPTREAVAKQIRREIRCHTDFSFELVDFFARMRDRARKSGLVHHIRQDDLDRFHADMDVIMPDEAVAEPGSAHDLLNRHLLDPARGELAFMHTKAYDGPVVDCAVVISLIPGTG